MMYLWRSLFFSLLCLAYLVCPVRGVAEEVPLKVQRWSFQGPFGMYDPDALRRGYKVYKQVCATCHSMNYVHFRDLAQEGGPQFTPGQVKTLASEYKVQDGPNSSGDMFERPGLPKDAFPNPFPNEEAARAAHGGALPPDLSLIVKAREGGPDYIYSLLTGFGAPPKDNDPNHKVETHPGLYYNPYFTTGNGWIAMPPPLADDIVSYDDGTPSDVDHLARDVTYFLMWASEPKLEMRHRIGFQVIVYLGLLAVLLYFTVKRLWRDLH